MEQIQIQSNHLSVTISTLGAEITSVKHQITGREFIWNADPSVWNRHAPILFPFVGKNNQGKYRHHGHEFEVGQHGFARDMYFEVTEIYTDFIRLMLQSNEQTKSIYPFEFKLFVSYKVIENTVEVQYEVINTDIQNMYFSIGAHPGFLLPEKNLHQFAIYFNRAEPNLKKYLIQEGLQNHQTVILELDAHQSLRLDENSFEQDAMVFKGLNSNGISLKHLSSNWEVKMEFEGFPYFGIWTKHPNQAFVCLEPWAGITDAIDFKGNLEEKEGIYNVGPSSKLDFHYKMIFKAD